eukprot:TRINITY_DN818_c0_g1_i1.p1 TRINITY_DN818_c0_g1~~TRINITY_DN818_c0_g1_i1.p1  ORF type:complete len:176 (-),score=52.78 TRINITY_DN818_c0_g1_i1:164-691(-)
MCIRDSYYAGEAFANLTNAIFNIDEAVVNFMHGWRGRNDTLPPTKVKKIAACIRGVKKIYNTIKIIAEAFKTKTVDIAALISGSLETILTTPYTTKVCYYAFKNDAQPQNKEMLLYAVPVSQDACQGAVEIFMSSLGDAMMKHENGEETVEAAQALFRQVGRISAECQEKTVVAQ